MLCIACARPGSPLCVRCDRSLVAAPPVWADGVLVAAPFRHAGAAVRLVHNLKYRRSLSAARYLAAAMARRAPRTATSLVPVRRSPVRRVRYGIDQGAVLADLVSAATGLPVVDALVPPLWTHRRAGAPRDRRGAVPFAADADVPDGAVIVDDVWTTGMTALSAVRATGAAQCTVLVATRAGSMGHEADGFPDLGGDVLIDGRARRGSGIDAPPSPRLSTPVLRRRTRARPEAPVEREETG